MLIFVDESGDTGLKIGKGSSTLFTVTLVAIPHEETAQALNNRIVLLRQELKLSEAFEFHFKENSDTVRIAFLNAVAPFPFAYTGIIVNKSRITSDFAKPKTFHKQVCGLLFDAAKGTLSNANVKIDKTGGHDFRRELAAYLKQQTNPASSDEAPRIKAIKMEPSHGNNLLQLADMVCGALHRAHDNGKPQPERFRKIIKHRENAVLYFPEKLSPPTIGM